MHKQCIAQLALLKNFYTKWQWEDSSHAPASSHQIYSPMEVIFPLYFRFAHFEMLPDLELP